MRCMNGRLLTIGILLSVVALASGKSSKLVTSWKNPNYTGGQEVSARVGARVKREDSDPCRLRRCPGGITGRLGYRSDSRQHHPAAAGGRANRA